MPIPSVLLMVYLDQDQYPPRTRSGIRDALLEELNFGGEVKTIVMYRRHHPTEIVAIPLKAISEGKIFANISVGDLDSARQALDGVVEATDHGIECMDSDEEPFLDWPPPEPEDVFCEQTTNDEVPF